jgi:hypothetical protein
MNITSARETLHCRKTRIPCEQYSTHDDKPERCYLLELAGSECMISRHAVKGFPDTT